MNITKNVIALTIGALFAVPALAQDASEFIQRNAQQQERIEQGLRSGGLTVQEAAGLERRAGRIETNQARSLADGTLSQDEARRTDRAQDRFGREIQRQGNDADTGNPNSASARRMAADVDRNGDEQRRIAQGLRSGDLTNQEAARLERGQAQVNRGQAQAGADGRIDRNEQRGIQQAQNRQSQQIRQQRHDEQRGDGGGRAPRDAQGRDHPGNNGQHRGWENRGSRGGQGFDQARNERRETSGNRGFNQQRSETRQPQARAETRQAQPRFETRQSNGARGGNQTARVASAERRR